MIVIGRYVNIMFYKKTIKVSTAVKIILLSSLNIQRNNIIIIVLHTKLETIERVFYKSFLLILNSIFCFILSFSNILFQFCIINDPLKCTSSMVENYIILLTTGFSDRANELLGSLKNYRL